MFKKLLLGLLLMTSMTVNANELSNKDIRVVVTGNPASSLGIVARTFAKYASDRGIRITLDWRAGSDGIIGANYFVSRPRDGTTLLLSSVFEVTRDVSYQSFKTQDIVPIGVVPMAPMWIVANPAVPYNNLSELVSALNKDPQAVSWAVTNRMFESVLSEFSTRIGLEYNDLLATKFNAKGSLAISSVVGGHLDIGMLVAPIIKPVVDGKQLKLLGVVNKSDRPSAPGTEDLETILGSQFTQHGHVMFLPAGTRAQLQQHWVKIFQEFVEDPEVKKELGKHYLSVPEGNNQELAQKTFNAHYNQTAQHGQPTLTNRQQQVLRLIQSRGASNKAIAETLDLSESAVKLHVSEILKKYNVKTRLQLLAFE